ELKTRLDPLPYGKELAQYLETGLPAIALGCNGALKTAVENDSPLRNIAYAQETLALGKPGDVFIGISTSGNAENCLMAMSVARAVGMTVVSLTGPKGGKMAEFADIALRAPGNTTKEIQEAHLALYHTFCALIEAHYFPEMR
ncbi:MAG TPA: SIS domain-containing protein, partial [Candidatus Hydrogenedentes bacterium]|nr:SIS domain-containing protein [Candidatus Hydrogenedentota bacterium]